LKQREAAVFSVVGKIEYLCGMKKTISTYLLDMSKLTYGGVVLYAAVRQEVELTALIVIGAIAVTLTAAAGLIVQYFEVKSQKKQQQL